MNLFAIRLYNFSSCPLTSANSPVGYMEGSICYIGTVEGKGIEKFRHKISLCQQWSRTEKNRCRSSVL